MTGKLYLSVRDACGKGPVEFDLWCPAIIADDNPQVLPSAPVVEDEWRTGGTGAARVFAKINHVCGAQDNLGKGAIGQAIQNANLICGLPETTGLDGNPVWP